jgi:hypothetical protein
MTAVMHPVAVSIIMQFRNLPGYPADQAGLDQLADALCEVAKSVDHARAIIARFEICPTAEQIRQAGQAINCNAVPQREQN